MLWNLSGSLMGTEGERTYLEVIGSIYEKGVWQAKAWSQGEKSRWDTPHITLFQRINCYKNLSLELSVPTPIIPGPTLNLCLSPQTQTPWDPQPQGSGRHQEFDLGQLCIPGQQGNASSWHSIRNFYFFSHQKHDGTLQLPPWHHEYNVRIKTHYGLHRTVRATCTENVMQLPKYLLKTSFCNKIFQRFGNIYTIQQLTNFSFWKQSIFTSQPSAKWKIAPKRSLRAQPDISWKRNAFLTMLVHPMYKVCKRAGCEKNLF